jgi:hypothetical protein
MLLQHARQWRCAWVLFKLHEQQLETGIDSTAFATRGSSMHNACNSLHASICTMYASLLLRVLMQATSA